MKTTVQSDRGLVCCYHVKGRKVQPFECIEGLYMQDARITRGVCSQSFVNLDTFIGFPDVAVLDDLLCAVSADADICKAVVRG